MSFAWQLKRSCRVRAMKKSVLVGGAVSILIVLMVVANLLLKRPVSSSYWLPCATIDCKGATTLDNAPVDMLKRRRNSPSIVHVQDFHELNGLAIREIANVYFEIPQVIHQVWLGDKTPPYAWVDSWRFDYVQQCSGWSHMLWTPDNYSSLQHLDPIQLEPESILSGQADIVRGAILYQHGGVYIDADTLWINGHCLDGLLDLASTTGFLTAIEPAGDEGLCQDRVANGVMAAVRHHPVVREYMQVQRFFTISKGLGVHPWERLGPLALTAAVNVADNFNCLPERKLTEWDQYNQYPAGDIMLATVLHPKYFYPKSWHGVTQQTANDTEIIKTMMAKDRPGGMMFQFGLTTNFLETSNVQKLL
ncbi:TPA: hypothetical protein ACH3X3_001244 [Trebouxia sp. C0006]